MHRTCFLMGHRDTPESVFPLLKEAVFFLARETGEKPAPEEAPVEKAPAEEAKNQE